jgi:hypothetical protein
VRSRLNIARCTRATNQRCLASMCGARCCAKGHALCKVTRVVPKRIFWGRIRVYTAYIGRMCVYTRMSKRMSRPIPTSRHPGTPLVNFHTCIVFPVVKNRGVRRRNAQAGQEAVCASHNCEWSYFSGPILYNVHPTPMCTKMHYDNELYLSFGHIIERKFCCCHAQMRETPHRWL